MTSQMLLCKSSATKCVWKMPGRAQTVLLKKQFTDTLKSAVPSPKAAENLSSPAPPLCDTCFEEMDGAGRK